MDRANVEIVCEWIIEAHHATVEKVFEWIIKVHNEIKPDLTQKSFKRFSIFINVDKTECMYLFINQNDNDCENENELDDAPEALTENLYYELLMLSDNENFLSS